MECKRQNLVSFWTFFLLFYSRNNPAKQTFEKKSVWRYITILQKCAINDNNMMHGSWDMKRDTIFVILDHFLHFYNRCNPKT